MDTGHEFKVNNSEEGMVVGFTSPLEDGFMPVETAQEVTVQEQQLSEKEKALNYLATSFSESNHNSQLTKYGNSQAD